MDSLLSSTGTALNRIEHRRSAPHHLTSLHVASIGIHSNALYSMFSFFHTTMRERVPASTRRSSADSKSAASAPYPPCRLRKKHSFLPVGTLRRLQVCSCLTSKVVQGTVGGLLHSQTLLEPAHSNRAPQHTANSKQHTASIVMVFFRTP